MKRHLNTLFVTSEGTYLAKDGEGLVARVENQTRLRLPITAIESVVCFGRVSYSPQALEHCAANGVAMSHLTETGRFMVRLEGPVSGNVVVRRTQYRWADDPKRTAGLARAFIIGKIANARLVRPGDHVRRAQPTAAPRRDERAAIVPLHVARARHPLRA